MINSQGQRAILELRWHHDLASGAARTPKCWPAGEPMRIGLIALPWIPVPPPAYGGIEAIVDALAQPFACPHL